MAPENITNLIDIFGAKLNHEHTRESALMALEMIATNRFASGASQG